MQLVHLMGDLRHALQALEHLGAQLEALCRCCDLGDSERNAAHFILHTLTNFPSLHTLKLGYQFIAQKPVVMGSLSQLTQLCVLCLNWGVNCRDLTPLSTLPYLDCLNANSLHGSDGNVRLPKITTIRLASDTTRHELGLTPAEWHPRMSDSISALAAFPSLKHLVGFDIRAGYDQRLVHLPGFMQWLGGSTQESSVTEHGA